MRKRNWTVRTLAARMSEDRLMRTVSLRLYLFESDPQVPLGTTFATELDVVFGKPSGYFERLEKDWRAHQRALQEASEAAVAGIEFSRPLPSRPRRKPSRKPVCLLSLIYASYLD